jgi:uncharacterized coiled-coil protein SlyX
MTELRSWIKDNSTLVYFLIAQAIAICTVGVSVISYMVRLETRVNTLEVRGSPHLSEINNRLTVTEKETEANKERVDRIVEVMTRELGKPIK